MSPGDLVWAHLNNPKNQPVITVVITFHADSKGADLMMAIKELEVLNRVMVEGHWVRREGVGLDYLTSQNIEQALSEALGEELSVEHHPYSILLGQGFLILRIHHGLGDGHTLVNALLGSETNPELKRERNGRKSSGLRTMLGLFQILAHKPKGLGKATGVKQAFILGPWSLEAFKDEAKHRNLSLNDAFLRALERAMERSGFPGVSAGATVELSGMGNNRFGLILTKLNNLSPVQVAAHGAASMGLISLAGKLGKKPVHLLINLLSKRIDLLVSNVKGPTKKIRIGGVELESLGFLVPTVGEVPLGVTLLSYAGEIRLGVSIDEGATIFKDDLLRSLNKEFDDLCQNPNKEQIISKTL